MLRRDDFLGFFDSGGRFQKEDGTVEVVFLTNRGHQMPGQLVFKGGLCVSAEIADATSWKYSDGSPLDGLRLLLHFEADEPLQIFIVGGRILPRDKADIVPLPSLDEFAGRRKLTLNQRAITTLTSLSPKDREAVVAILRKLADQDISELPQQVAMPVGHDQRIYLLQVTPEFRAFVRVVNDDTLELFDIVRDKTLQTFLEQAKAKGASP